MAALPTDIITEILSRLPVKSLLRFKCVCKFWNSLIKTPNFIKLHLNQALISNSDLHLIFCNKSLHSAEFGHDNISFSEVQLPLSTQEFELFGSCNGIICIANNDEILLFNPLTKSHFQVPIPKPNRVTRYVQWFMMGFGYDRKSDDYKVLKLSDDMDWKSVEAELYSRNNNSWKSVQGIYGFTLNTDWPVGVLVNEALHFLVCSQKTEYIIASFDLQTESFLFIDYSKLIDNTDYSDDTEIKELGRCLSAFINYYHPTEEDLYFMKGNIWVMKEYGNNESWVRLFSIGNESIPKLFGIMPIVYSKDGNKILLDICILKFGWYDMESKKFKAIKPHGLPKRPMSIGYYVECFVGSLVSIEDKLHSERETLPMIKKKSIIDNVQVEAMT